MKPLKRPKADFIYDLKCDHFLIIEDCHLGHMTVEEDMESVLKTIARIEQIDLEDYLIAYKDPQGIYNGVRVGGTYHNDKLIGLRFDIYNLNMKEEMQVMGYFKQVRLNEKRK